MSSAPSQKLPMKILNDPELRDWFTQFTRDMYFMWEERNQLVSPDGTVWKVDDTGTLIAV